MAHIDNRFLDVPHLVAQQIDGHHGQCVLVGALSNDVARVLVLHTQILAEAQRLRGQPRLLQLYEDEVLAAVGLANGGSEVDAVDRE